MSVIIQHVDATVTLEHEWPVPLRVEKGDMGEPVVALEVDTQYATAVIGLTRDEAFALMQGLQAYVDYYNVLDGGYTTWN